MRLLSWPIAFLITFFSLTLFAQEVTEIAFEQPEKEVYKIPESMILFRIQTRVGQPYNQQVANDDIKRLMQTGIIEDVLIKTTDEGHQFKVTFVLTPKPIVTQIRLIGMSNFNALDLSKLVKLQEATPLNDEKLNESCQAIRDFYLNSGYSQVKVKSEVKILPDKNVCVNILIDEGKRLRINDVKFENQTCFYDRTLKSKLANYYSILSRFLDFGIYLPDELENDKIRLRDAYWKKGYLDFEVQDVMVEPDSSDSAFVNLTFKLFEGEPYELSEIKIEGMTQFLPDNMLKDFKLKERGDIYNFELENKDVETILNAYYQIGFDAADVKVTRDANPLTHKVKITYTLVEGGPQTVRKILIKGNEVTKDYVIRRELKLEPGDPYDRLKVKKSQDRLMGLNDFNDVNISAYKTEEPAMRDMMIEVSEKQFFEPRIGGSYSDYDSLAGMITLRHSNFDITGWPDENSRLAAPNTYFSGGGQDLNAMALFGVERAAASIRFVEPWFMGHPYRFTIEGYFRNRYYDDWNEQYAGFEVAIGKQLAFIDDYTFIQLAYKFEQARVYEMESYMGPQFQSETGSEWNSSPSLLLSHNTLNNKMAPTQGHEVLALASVTPEALGSSRNFARFEIKAVQYFSFIEDILQGHIGGKIGAVPAFGDDETPLYERYFLGGGDTIRGFPYRSIGPVDDQNHVLGGTFMYIVTAEVSHPIWEFIRGAVFIDAGESTSNSANLGNTNIGAGYGLRIKIPGMDSIPPIKLDLAYPLKNEQPGCESKLRFHFDMGFAW